MMWEHKVRRTRVRQYLPRNYSKTKTKSKAKGQKEASSRRVQAAVAATIKSHNGNALLTVPGVEGGAKRRWDWTRRRSSLAGI